MSTQSRARFRRIGAHRGEEFARKMQRPSRFFPHDFSILPKCGPDAFKLAERMCGTVDAGRCFEVVLHAAEGALVGIPGELFFDDEVVWHRQQFGRIGQIATANLLIEGSRLYSMVHLSDVVQRIARRRELKTRMENRFRGWPHMLLNALLAFADERGLDAVCTPTAELARRHTDPAREVGTELFERIYDRPVAEQFIASREGEWWLFDLGRNRERIVVPEIELDPAGEERRVICIVHDVERGLGHLDSDPPFAAAAELHARASLDAMIAEEEAAGVVATYCVVGSLLPELRGAIERGRHSLAFHSYDHRQPGHGQPDQLALCREVDYRIKGYRATRSILTADVRNENLLFHNFEWLASSRWSFGFDQPVLDRGIVRIPIAFDDFELYHDGHGYDAWEERAIAEIEKSSFVAFGLHDCYGTFWLPYYRRLLEKLKPMGELITLDAVAARVTMRSAC